MFYTKKFRYFLYIILFVSGCFAQVFAGEYKETFDTNDTKYNFVCVSDVTQMQDLCNKLKSCRGFAVNTETTGLDPVVCDCVGISLCIQEGESYYIPFGHPTDEQLTKEQVVYYLKPIFEDEKIGKYLHNATFDMIFLYTMGIDLKGLAFDTCMAAYCLNPLSRYSLKELSEKYGHKDFVDAYQILKLTKVLAKEIEKEGLRDLCRVRLVLIEVDYENLKEKVNVQIIPVAPEY